MTPEKVTFVADNGFTEDEARDALEAAQGDVEKAIMALGMKQVYIFVSFALNYVNRYTSIED